MKVDVRGEVRAKNTAGRINILDLVIFQNNEPVMIIEVKKDTTKETTIQKKEYGTFSIPMRFILGMKQAQDYIKRVRSKITV
jgi:type I site-specific restriction-modification system R (restriction) subunit